MRKPWTEQDYETLRANYGSKTAAEIGALVGRTGAAVQQKAMLLGLSRRYGAAPELLAYVIEQHAAGKLDTEIARGWQAMHLDQHVCRETIAWYRRKVLGLPLNTERQREVRRESQRKQMQSLGISSFAELARRRHRRFVLQSGWPCDLKPLEVRILNALADHGGYMTRQEIAARIGYRSGDQRDWFKCRGGSQTAIGNLVHRGLVRRSQSRTRKGTGKGRTAFEYWIPLDVLRRYRKPRRLLG